MDVYVDICDFAFLDFQIHDRQANLFIDGLEEDGTPFDTKHLASMLFDVGDDGAMWVGRSSNGKNKVFHLL